MVQYSPRLSDRHGQFQDEVPAHVKHPSTACDHVQVGVFQAAQVVLVAHIGQVVDHKMQLGYLPSSHLDVGSGREADEQVGRCHRLGFVGRKIMVLLQIPIHIGSNVGIVEHPGIVRDFVFQIGRETRCRGHRQPFHLLGLVQQPRVDV